MPYSNLKTIQKWNDCYVGVLPCPPSPPPRFLPLNNQLRILQADPNNPLHCTPLSKILREK